MNTPERAVMISFLVECSSLAIIIVFAFVNCNRKQSSIAAIIIMSIANIVSQVIIAGGGPGAIVGVFVMPLLGVFFALTTITFRGLISKRRNPPANKDIIRSKRRRE
jgi:phosphate/sulfate permease